MGKKVVIGEGQINLIKEYLDKEYGIPLYRYLQQGNKVGRHPDGKLNDSKLLVPLFIHYMQTKSDEGSWRRFVKFCNANPKLNAHFKFDGWEKDIECYERFPEKRANLSDYVKRYSGPLYRMFAFGDIADIWEDFYMWYSKSPASSMFFGKHGGADANVVLYNPRVASTRWLIHFTPKESDAVNIVKNGFTRGIQKSQMNKMAFTNDGSINDDDKNGGVYSYAYDVEDILNADFIDKYQEFGKKPFQTNFDMKVWSNAIHYAVMFQAPGVKVDHMSDQDQQVIFNNRMARNFLMLRFVWLPWGNDNPKDPKVRQINLGGNDNIDAWWEVVGENDKSLYRNTSITKVVEWVVNNYGQYKNALLKEGTSWESADIGEIECTLNFDEDEYFEWLQDNGVENSDVAKKTVH